MSETYKIYPLKSYWKIFKLFFNLSIKQHPRHMKNFVILFGFTGIVDLLRLFQPSWFNSLKYKGSLLLVWIIVTIFLYFSLFLAFVIIFIFSRNKKIQFNDSEILIYNNNVLKGRILFKDLTDIQFKKFNMTIYYQNESSTRVLVLYEPSPKLLHFLIDLKNKIKS